MLFIQLGVGIVVGVAITLIVLWLRGRKQKQTYTLESLGLASEKPGDDSGEIARLRQNLRLKVMYDEAKIDRLVQAERDRSPNAPEVEWYRAAVERWERDNR